MDGELLGRGRKMKKVVLLESMHNVVMSLKSGYAREGWEKACDRSFEEIAADEAKFKRVTERFRRIMKDFLPYGFEFDKSMELED